METLYFWPEMPGLSIVVLLLVTMLFLWIAREPIHKAFEALLEGTSGGLKKMADSAKQLAEKMRERDRKVLLESGIGDAKQKLQEEFQRVEMSYTKHLSNYPALQRKLDDSISKIETDYKDCGQATPEAPGWNEAVASIAKVQGSSGDRVIEKMLSEIHKSAVDGEKRALTELRNTTSKRHKILSSMAPVWKSISKQLKEVGELVGSVLDTTNRIDKHMTQFEKISKGDQDSIDTLASRANKLFIFSSIIMVVAAVGAFVNFRLIALPMSELMNDGSRFLGMPVSDFSALVIILIEVFLGVFIMDALGITNIIPQIGTMERNKRRLILYASLFFLFLFACAEASLGVLREMLTEAKTAANQALAGSSAAVASQGASQITVTGQAILGFVLPWVLALVAMPLEVFIESSQHAFRKLLILLVNTFASLCRMLAFLIEYIIKIIIHLYDAYIIIPTKIGSLASNRGKLQNSGAGR